MIKVKDGKLQAELLDNKGTLSNKIIEQYDYIELKNDFATNYTYFSKTNTSLITLDRKNYDRSIEMCMILLKKVKASYDKLNEVEKFIIKSLEFDNPPETDEELMDRLMTYKNGYYLSKKSAYIKMALQLNIKNVIKRERTDIIKQARADACIVTISDNK